MTEWREITLGEALEVRHGFAFQGQYFCDEGELILLTPGNFYDTGGFKPKSGKEKYYDGPLPPGYLLSKGDVVVAMTEQSQGLLGSTATIPASGRYLHNQRLGLLNVSDPTKLDLRFSYHLMNSEIVRSQIQATATGAKVRHTAPERICGVRARVPDVSVQRVVADILDALDDLIGINLGRTDLLEQMAQAVYREWFINFRYPGHEGVVLVDSPLGLIPEGWEVTTIGHVLELRYGKALKAADRKGGSVAVVGSSDVVGWHDEGIVSGPAIVVGRKGNVGNVTWVPGPCWPIDTTYYVDTSLQLRYVAEQLKRAEFINTHAAVPGLSRDQAYSLPFLLPPSDIMLAFAGIADTLGQEQKLFTEQTERLAAIRDFLLPKLVTGLIDVSSLHLDNAVVESVA